MVAVRLIHNSSRKHTCLVLVNDEHRDLLYGRNWFPRLHGGHYYIQSNKTYTTQYSRLHREVLGFQEGDSRIVDHINGNTCDNQKTNLRIATHSQNAQNKRVRSDSKTGCKGVSYRASRGILVWEAEVSKHGVRYHKGFTTKAGADTWVRAKREELHGEYHRHA